MSHCRVCGRLAEEHGVNPYAHIGHVFTPSTPGLPMAPPTAATDPTACTTCMVPYKMHLEAYNRPPGYVSNCAVASGQPASACAMCPGRCHGPHAFGRNGANYRIVAFTGAYAFLSDHYPAATRIYDRTYLTLTHAFLAAMRAVETDRASFWEPRLADPADAVEHARSVPQRHDADAVAEATLGYLTHDKFTRNPLLKDLLLATGEHRIFDPHGERQGIGARLTQIRDALREPPF